MKEFKVKAVDNGYILTVTVQGVNVLKELYERPVMVFTSLADLQKYISLELSKPE